MTEQAAFVKCAKLLRVMELEDYEEVEDVQEDFGVTLS